MKSTFQLFCLSEGRLYYDVPGKGKEAGTVVGNSAVLLLAVLAMSSNRTILYFALIYLFFILYISPI